MSFTEEEITNAKKICEYFTNKGWTLQAICGMLGNFVIESYLNPTQWEIGMPEWGPETGYGLAQWTPATNLTDWCEEEGLPYDELTSQCACIEYEMTHAQQFFPSASYSMDASEYINSTDSPYTLGLVWLANYERPRNPYQPIRGQLAEQWYELLDNTSSSTSSSNTPSSSSNTPSSSSNTPSSSTTPEITYTVESGDTLTGIAEEYGVTIAELQAWNNISNPNNIYVGEVLKIYTNGSDDSGDGGSISYTVQSGDTLSGIAEEYGVTVAELQAWNNISNPNDIYAGEILKIYTNGSDDSGNGGSISYTVQSGDTLSTIAEEYGVTVEELVEWNNISNPDDIYVGEVLKIYTNDSNDSGDGGSISYTVQSGDTLTSIAATFDVTIEELQQWNDISNPNDIYVGEVLEIY
ncbi:phage tail tip lysozyme [Sarcina ventriculi]|uniref:phage tail tip lysozyme n=1 Tax=Sarcina ventriculi TaxID=1267 RepID=UPI0018AB51FB|nr:phage tail tip lysozyme [Sarcina ventriculi]